MKKLCYWTKFIPGNMIGDYFTLQEVDTSDLIHGFLDGIPYNILCMKNPGHSMKIMFTYSGLYMKDGQEESWSESLKLTVSKLIKIFNTLFCS